jgi:ABC-type lipoprotein release transport system permease subunit
LQRDNSSRSIIINGIEIQNADKIYHISQNIVAGDPFISGNDVLIGSELASDLNLKKAIAYR